jgi:hypothetical protein
MGVASSEGTRPVSVRAIRGPDGNPIDFMTGGQAAQ